MALPADPDQLREQVRARYAAAATTECSRPDAARCCGNDLITGEQRAFFGSQLYDDADREAIPDSAVVASLGCGNPLAIAELHEGETVLDLGSGGGIDVLLSARRVGPTGLAYGLDMTDEMLDLARRNQAEAGVTNVHWLRGEIESIPLPANAVDVIISNCVINLSSDKHQLYVQPDWRRRCIAGALTRQEFTDALSAAGLIDIEIQETHRVHPTAASAIVRAAKPNPNCSTGAQAAAASRACATAEPRRR